MGKGQKKPRRVQPRLAKGFRDQVGASVADREQMLATIRTVYERFGFVPLQTPVVEYAEVLTGAKAGETGQHIFHWHHEEDDVELGLRFDLTVPLARFVAANPQLRRPFKRYQVGTVYRVDKPGAGRFREFTQCDIDIVGTNSMLADAEILVAMGQVLDSLGLPAYTLRWNHRGLLNAALARAGVDAEMSTAVIRVLDKEDKIGAEGVGAELGAGRIDAESEAKIPGVGLPADQIAKVLEFLALDAADDEALLVRLTEFFEGVEGAAAALSQVAELREFAAALGGDPTKIHLHPRLARGMDYYTGPIFEATLDELPHYGSIMGGGRYDGLVGRFSGEQLSGVGASVGIDRLLAALQEGKEDHAPRSRSQVLVTAMDKKLLPEYAKLVRELRDGGLRAELWLKPKSRLGDQLRYASEWGIPFAVIMGEDELAAGEITVKDLEAGAEAAKDIADRAEWVEERPGQFSLSRGVLLARLRELCAE